MIKFNYLSEAQVDLTPAIKQNKTTTIADITDDARFKDCPITAIQSKGRNNFYTIILQSGKVIRCENGCECTLVPVANGYLADSYVLIERDTYSNVGSTKVYVLSGHKVLTLASVEGKNLTLLDVDALVGSEYLTRRTAEELNHFDFSHRTQWFELFCEDLPRSCLAHPNFRTDVLTKLKNIGDITISGDIDRRFIDTKYCKEYAKKYFEQLCEKYREEESGS